MHIVTRAQFNKFVVSLAGKYNKTPDEVRDILTPEKLAELGYRVETLVEQLQREGVYARENMIVERLQSKGLL